MATKGRKSKIYRLDHLKGPLKVDLGSGLFKPEGYLGLDIVKMKGVDFIADLNKRLPFADNSFDEVRARFVIEHVDNVFFTMEEIHRILKPKGKLSIFVPYACSFNTYADLQHRKGFNEKSFDAFTETGEREYSWHNYYTTARYYIDSVDLEGGRLYKFLKIFGLDGIANRYLNNVVATVHVEMRARK
ncbi:class I SAM-dependent methyltransferase [Candidatus Micrarchaeota archaeon]|nr:class I SAM-dependent methyltransferase [Candidatus Micrarchaeota archaeon]